MHRVNFIKHSNRIKGTFGQVNLYIFKDFSSVKIHFLRLFIKLYKYYSNNAYTIHNNRNLIGQVKKNIATSNLSNTNKMNYKSNTGKPTTENYFFIIKIYLVKE